MITVLGKSRWTRRTGYLGSGIDGQVTAIDTPHGRAWVRENFQFTVGSFYVHSSARLGAGGGVVGNKVCAGMNPRASSRSYLQVLELCTEAPGAWKPIAEAVHAADPMHRPVTRNRGWTPARARATFATP